MIPPGPLSYELLSKLVNEAVNFKPRPPMTEEEMVSRMAPRHQKAYWEFRTRTRRKSRQFRWLRRQLFKKALAHLAVANDLGFGERR